MNQKTVLANEAGVQVNEHITNERELSFENSNSAIIGEFKRGEIGRAVIVTPDNIRAVLGHDLTKPAYRALLDAFESGLDSVVVIRIPDNSFYEPIISELRRVNNVDYDYKFIWEQNGGKTFNVYVSESEIDDHDLPEPLYTDIKSDRVDILIKESKLLFFKVVGFYDGLSKSSRVVSFFVDGYFNQPNNITISNTPYRWINHINWVKDGICDSFNIYISDNEFYSHNLPDVFANTTDSNYSVSFKDDGVKYVMVSSVIDDEEKFSNLHMINVVGSFSKPINVGCSNNDVDWTISWLNGGEDVDYYNVYISEVELDYNNLPEPTYTDLTDTFIRHEFQEYRTYYIAVSAVFNDQEKISTSIEYKPLVDFYAPTNLSVSQDISDLSAENPILSWSHTGVTDGYNIYVSNTPINTSNLPEPVAVMITDKTLELSVGNGLKYVVIENVKDRLSVFSEQFSFFSKYFTDYVDMDFTNGFVNAVDGVSWSTRNSPTTVIDVDGTALRTDGTKGINRTVSLGANWDITFDAKILSQQESGYNASFIEYGSGSGGDLAGNAGLLGCFFGNRIIIRDPSYFVDRTYSANTLYSIRIKCRNRFIQVYINGVIRGSKTLANANDRVLSFGYGNVNWYKARNINLYRFKINKIITS